MKLVVGRNKRLILVFFWWPRVWFPPGTSRIRTLRLQWARSVTWSRRYKSSNNTYTPWKLAWHWKIHHFQLQTHLQMVDVPFVMLVFGGGNAFESLKMREGGTSKILQKQTLNTNIRKTPNTFGGLSQVLYIHPNWRSLSTPKKWWLRIREASHRLP